MDRPLAPDLLDLDLGPNGKILQYVDDILICSPDEKSAQQQAIHDLNFLAERGYKVSHAKAQMVKTKVTYLGVQITHGSRKLSSDPVQGILQLPSPMTRKQLQAFLGLTGYCRIWKPNYGLTAQPLYESLKGQDNSIPLIVGNSSTGGRGYTKTGLNSGTCLEVARSKKAFQLHVHEREGIALGLLTQRLGSEPQPVAYLSKRLGPTTEGWSPCLPSKSCSYCNHDRRCFKTLLWGQTIPANK